MGVPRKVSIGALTNNFVYFPAMIAATDISLQYGSRVLFREVSFRIGPRDRIGLVGSNGAGKSTLLRMLLGEIQPDAGEIARARYVTTGYLPQEGMAAAGRPLFDEAASVFSDVLEVQERLALISRRLEEVDQEGAEAAELLELYGELQHRLEASDAFRMTSTVEKVLFGLGFREADLTRPTEVFSGGWQMRIALAKLLLQQPSLLLLDEPTNHLDLDSLEWLEEYLRTYEGAVMIVSHDRRFLDTMTRTTYELSQGRLTEYTGGYSAAMEERELRREQLLAAQRNQEEQIRHTERFIERFRYKATKARQVQSRIKALGKLERIEVEDDEDAIHFAFPPALPGGRVALEVRGLVKRYGDLTVFNGLDFTVERGDRMAFVGVNGAGKSTLSRILAGAEPPDAGERVPGYRLVLSYFAQHQAEELDPDLTVLETVEQTAEGESRRHLRTLLGSFLFRGDDVFKPVRVLSGGEKSRLALAKMLLRPANLLILDEPTNHLDMRSKAVLQEALLRFEGSIVVVSHDRDFLDPLVSKVVEFRAGRVRTVSGTVTEYLEARKREEERAAAAAPAEKILAGDKERKRREAEQRQRRYERTRPVQDRLSAVEKTIEAGEAEKAELERRMADPGFYRDGEVVRDVTARYRTLGEELTAAYWTWDSLTKELERLSADDAPPEPHGQPKGRKR